MNIVLTEEDVLRGSAIITVEQRDGKPVKVHCKALSWAASLKVNSMDTGDSTVLIVLSGVDKEQANDKFLNEITPAGLFEIANVVMQLTNGLPALKKTMAARNQPHPAMPTSTPPPANCESTDSVVASVMDSAPRS